MVALPFVHAGARVRAGGAYGHNRSGKKITRLGANPQTVVLDGAVGGDRLDLDSESQVAGVHTGAPCWGGYQSPRNSGHLLSGPGSNQASSLWHKLKWGWDLGLDLCVGRGGFYWLAGVPETARGPEMAERNPGRKPGVERRSNKEKVPGSGVGELAPLGPAEAGLGALGADFADDRAIDRGVGRLAAGRLPVALGLGLRGLTTAPLRRGRFAPQSLGALDANLLPSRAGYRRPAAGGQPPLPRLDQTSARILAETWRLARNTEGGFRPAVHDKVSDTGAGCGSDDAGPAKLRFPVERRQGPTIGRAS